MKLFCTFLIWLLVTALLAACGPAANSDPITTTDVDTGSTISATLPISEIVSDENSVFRFLQETNHTGTIIPYEEVVPPGFLPEVWRIPQPDQNLIGQTVDIVLSVHQEKTPFYFCCTDNGLESLYVFLPAEIPMLIRFETNVGGIQGLYKHIGNRTVFQGKISAMVNLSYEEGNIYAYNVCYYQEDISVNEILNDGTDLVTGKCMGVLGYRETGDTQAFKLLLKGANLDNISHALEEDFAWMQNKLKRFGLTDIKS